MGFRQRIGRALRRAGRVLAQAGWSMTIGGLELLRNSASRLSKTGKAVTIATALETSIVLAIWQRIAFDVAGFPWKVFQMAAGGKGKTEAHQHALFELLHLRPNDFQTSWDFRVALMFNLLARGEYIVFKNYVKDQKTGKRVLVELLPLDKCKIEPKAPGSYELRYFLDGQGGRQEIGADLIWHIRGPSYLLNQPLRPVELAREALGLSMLAEETQVDFQKRGLRLPGVLSMDGDVPEDQYEAISKWVREQAQKDIAETGVMVIDKSAKFTAVMMTPEAAQVIETRRHQIEELCRHWNLWPVMIGHPADMAARASIESILTMHDTKTIDPWLVCLEQSAAVHLLAREERQAGLKIGFVRAALFRADLQSQGEFLAKMMGQGATGPGQAALTPNEVREFMDVNPRDDGDQLSQGPQQPKTAEPAPAPGGTA